MKMRNSDKSDYTLRNIILASVGLASSFVFVAIIWFWIDGASQYILFGLISIFVGLNAWELVSTIRNWFKGIENEYYEIDLSS